MISVPWVSLNICAFQVEAGVGRPAIRREGHFVRCSQAWSCRRSWSQVGALAV